KITIMFSGADSRGRRAVQLAFAAVILVAAGVAGALIANALNNNSGASTTTTTAAAGAVSGPSCDVTSVAQQKLPTVVTIQAHGAGGGGVGSGEIIRSDGYTLTNNHVILPAVAAGRLEVIFENGHSAQATIVGRDPLTDLAVIRVQGVSDLQPI